jgi:hypothetical protein
MLQLPNVKNLTSMRVVRSFAVVASKVAALVLALIVFAPAAAHAAPFDQTYYFSCTDGCFQVGSASQAEIALRVAIPDVENFGLGVGAFLLDTDTFASQAAANYPDAVCKDVVAAGCVEFTLTPLQAGDGPMSYTNPYSIGVAWSFTTCPPGSEFCFDPGIIGLTDNFSQVTVALRCGGDCFPPVLLKSPGSDFGSYAPPDSDEAVHDQVYYPTMDQTTLADAPLPLPEPGTLLLVGFGAAAGVYRRRTGKA